MSADVRAESRIDSNTGEFRLFSWSELRSIIARNELHILTRTPDQLSIYLAWKTEIVKDFGSVESYILRERLGWTLPITPKSEIPFLEASDWKCLRNDFPYALEPSIQHLVVWLKFKLPTDASGVLTTDAIQTVESFIRSYFKDVRDQDLLYFLNPPALKSIGDLEHFHVLVHHREVSRYCQN